MAVTHPEAGNIGGGGFMVIRMADGRSAAFDYREVAPLAAAPDMYVPKDGGPSKASLVGARAVGVPGAVAGLAAAQAAFGRLSLRDVLAPAIRLAGEGFVVDSAFARSIAGAQKLIAMFDGAAVFLPGGAPPAIGTTFKQAALARTLTLIATSGPGAFYRGTIGQALVSEMRADGGLITAQDLERYQAIRRQVLRSTYRGDTLLTMPPASSGGVTLIESLNILETYEHLPPFGSATYAHILADAFQRAFIDRNGKLSDPAFVNVPVAQLTDKAYARRLRATISADRATPTNQLTTALGEGAQTTHYSVVDSAATQWPPPRRSMACTDLACTFARPASFSTTEWTTSPPDRVFRINSGSSKAPECDRPRQAHAERDVADDRSRFSGPRSVGRRRARWSTHHHQHSPGHPECHRSRNGARRRTGRPRIHHQAIPDSLRYDRNGLAPLVRDTLTTMGHALAAGGASGTCTAVMRVAGGLAGAVDPRSTGGAAGY